MRTSSVHILIISANPHPYIKRIRRLYPKLKVFYTSEKKALNLIQNADIVMDAEHFSLNVFHKSKRLKWVHTDSTGVERYLHPEFVQSPIVLTNSRGVHAVPVAEHSFALMLNLARQFPCLMRDQLRKRWGNSNLRVQELWGKTVGIIGLGSTGSEVARRAKCFGMKVIAVKKNVVLGGKYEYVDMVYSPCQLGVFLRKADFVVICVPLTKETQGMIGEQQLGLMKQSAYLINVSRAGIVDQKALVRALKERWIAGAGLDVFEEEPLPPSSELYRMEDVIITPHLAGKSCHLEQRKIDLFSENLRRFLQGKRLLNIVNKNEGY